MEDPERRVDIKLISIWEDPDSSKTGRKVHCAKTLISKFNFHSATKINDNFYAIQMKRLSVLFNKPMYLGFAVLDLSKWKMYDFHYQYMKPKFQEKLLLNNMDTDSFIYTIKAADFYKDIRNDLEAKLDTSDHSDERTHLYNCKRVNKKSLGFFKDELNGKFMTEFVGLCSKVYCYKIGKVESSLNKAKEVSSRNLTIEDYKNVLLTS